MSSFDALGILTGRNDLGAAAFLIWATVTWGTGNRVRFLLTASLIYGGIRLAKPAVRRLRGHRTGRK